MLYSCTTAAATHSPSPPHPNNQQLMSRAFKQINIMLCLLFHRKHAYRSQQEGAALPENEPCTVCTNQSLRETSLHRLLSFNEWGKGKVTFAVKQSAHFVCCFVWQACCHSPQRCLVPVKIIQTPLSHDRGVSQLDVRMLTYHHQVMKLFYEG